jgi:hypothetical protein
MSISKAPVILAIATILAVLVGCSGGGFSGSWTYNPGDLDATNLRPFETGSISVALECCESESTMLGDMWVASLVVENNTEISIRNVGFSIQFAGKDDFVFPKVETDGEVDLAAGKKTRMKLYLYSAESERFIDPKDIDSKSVKTIGGLSYE